MSTIYTLYAYAYCWEYSQIQVPSQFTAQGHIDV